MTYPGGKGLEPARVHVTCMDGQKVDSLILWHVP